MVLPARKAEGLRTGDLPAGMTFNQAHVSDSAPPSGGALFSGSEWEFFEAALGGARSVTPEGALARQKKGSGALPERAPGI